MDRRYKRMRSGPCRNFRPASADAFGYHPHGVEFGPEDPNPDRDQAQIGDLPRLFAVLDRLTRAGRIGAPGRRFDVYLTEFGYQTSPPDHGVGIIARAPGALPPAGRLPRVAAAAGAQPHAVPVARRAGRRPRRRAAALRGLAVGAALRQRQAQAGVPRLHRAVRDRPPPGRTRARFWGQIRPGTGVADRHGPAAAPGPDGFRVVTRMQTDARGFWTRTLPVAAAREVPLLLGAGRGHRRRPLPTRRLSGVVSLATDPARQWHASRP